MNGGMNRGNVPRVPLLGQQSQQQQQQAIAHQIVTTCYLSLVPIVAQSVLSNPAMYCSPDEIPERIADEAWRCTAAAVRRLGVKVPDHRPEEKTGESEPNGAA